MLMPSKIAFAFEGGSIAIKIHRLWDESDKGLKPILATCQLCHFEQKLTQSGLEFPHLNSEGRDGGFLSLPLGEAL